MKSILIFIIGITLGIIIARPSADIMQLTWISDSTMVEDKFTSAELQLGFRPLGVANSREDGCTIWVHEPEGIYDRRNLQILGHEVLHCYRGSYHE